MSCKIDNNAYEIPITTPQRKRKREPESPLCHGLTNAGFSSTPKKEAKLLINTFNRFPSSNENRKVADFVNSSCLEVKSIAEIVNEKSLQQQQQPDPNHYEIPRKPPKKKKKHDDENGGCFVNLGLNLDVPEKSFNPFEVKRTDVIASNNENNNCFTNAGLNIRSQEQNLAVNPFEISRNKIIDNHAKTGIENPALDMPTTLTIAVPFQPTIGCRIDFNGLPLENLTPSKLLAEKLVFSPDIVINKKTPSNKSFRRSLSVISEETIDIGKELDCYQLELENSINEAKIRKNKDFEQKLQNVEESIEYSEETLCSFNISQIEQNTNTSPSLTAANVHDEKKDGEVEKNKNEYTSEIIVNNDSKEENDLDEIDFKTPAPFVRAYRKPTSHIQKKDINNPEAIKIEGHPNQDSTGKGRISNVIHRSFRKLIHPHKKESASKQSEEKDHHEGGNIFSTLRQSLRRRHKNENKKSKNPNDEINQDNSNEKVELKDENEKENKVVDYKKNQECHKESLNDISILDVQERKIFRSTTKDENCKVEEVIIERRATLRSSIRKTSKGMRNQFLKSVFHKKVDEYDLKE